MAAFIDMFLCENREDSDNMLWETKRIALDDGSMCINYRLKKSM